MRGADGGEAVVRSFSWQLLLTSTVNCIINDQCCAGSAQSFKNQISHVTHMNMKYKMKARELRCGKNANRSKKTLVEILNN